MKVIWDFLSGFLRNGKMSSLLLDKKPYGEGLPKSKGNKASFRDSKYICIQNISL